MSKLNQFKEPLDKNIQPIKENESTDDNIDNNNSEVCINLSIYLQITKESYTQPFLQIQQHAQRSPFLNNEGLVYSSSELQSEINQFSSMEELSSKLNTYIDSYLQELRQPQSFLEQLSFKQSESYEEDSSESLCQRIYSKFVSQINLSVVQSYDYISSIDEKQQEETPLSLSTPILNQEVEILPDKTFSGSKKLFQDQFHLTCSYPLSQV
ncbi:unnamed protein product (macronuclear) [Paramecium tetraurelia]|uniref:Uncharacterized protein n=1 Tax=Paramecium tetraurelia TaxID=5888 RepID=A0C0N1_PARTE|nr:uncharacterized protein GSPATT00006201001 [Paramecium tetraurelia]CAK64348.1 unnamed protein product [Paramecium tetraurelia]|eukprot:XP_001431746.1 hypothetical protein (macronuclear) [Paramecium tetraurelia strain d4-2]